MISQDLINTRLGLILSRLGKQVSNAALFREELRDACPTDEEILAEDQVYLAEEAAKAQTAQAAKQKEAAYSAWIAQGYNTGLGYKLAVATDDQNAFARFMVGIQTLALPNDYVIEKIVKDMDGNTHDLTVGQFKTMMQGYTLHCMAARAGQ